MSDTLPNEVREAIKAAISDKRTPYVSRRNKSYDDGRIYEVIRLDNPDWRDVITDDQTVMGRFPNDKEADALCADLEAEFRLDAALSALEAAGWACVPKEATPEMCIAAQKSELRGGGLAFFKDVWTAMLTASNPKEKPDV